MSYFPESISPKPMNPEIKRQWLEALRSGEYKQGQRRLRERVKGGSLYCCLGVLCDLHSKATGEAWNIHGPYFYCGCDVDLPLCVNQWAGIGYDKMEERESTICLLEGVLVDANDSGADFPTIANWIEDNL